jgi:hypothetical protein
MRYPDAKIKPRKFRSKKESVCVAGKETDIT